jgi:hypothetical protein
MSDPSRRTRFEGRQGDGGATIRTHQLYRSIIDPQTLRSRRCTQACRLVGKHSSATTRTSSRPVKKHSGKLNEGSRLEIPPRLSFTLGLRVRFPMSGSQDNSLDQSFGASRETGIILRRMSPVVARLRHAKPRNECRLKSAKQTSPGGEQVARENYSYSSVGRPSGAASS